MQIETNYRFKAVVKNVYSNDCWIWLYLLPYKLLYVMFTHALETFYIGDKYSENYWYLRTT
jgi:hypothetical protein